jgi:hypothetical protein
MYITWDEFFNFCTFVMTMLMFVLEMNHWNNKKK